MKKIAIIMCIILSITGCAHSPVQKIHYDDEKLNIISTVFPSYDFARQIGKDRVNLHMLIPPGSESHTYEPSPADIIAIEQCDIFVYTGGNGDEWIKSVIETIHSDTVFVAMTDAVPPLEVQHIEGMQTESHRHHIHSDECHDIHGEHPAEYDEHVWTSPVNAGIICRYLTDKMCAIDSANAPYYEANCSEYLSELAKLDTDIRDIVSSAKRNTIIFGDRFPIRYFTEEYGINYFAAFPGCATEVEPAPATLTFLIDKVRDDDISVVFYRELSNKKVAQIISEDTDAEMRQFHSCHSVTKQEFERDITYIDLMMENITNLKEALD